VASWLLPADLRPHVAAVYAFARTADDFADEGNRPQTERLALLEDWRRWLAAAAAGEPAHSDDETAAIFTALGATIRQCQLDVQLLEDLLSAFRQDVLVNRYATWRDLLDYCRRSANPIGRLVLSIARHNDPAAFAYADHLCTALQLANFWQDLAIDWKRGRLYVPADVMSAHGALDTDLNRQRLTAAWIETLRDVAARTRTLFLSGKPVADVVAGRLRWELRATWLGGMRILDKLERTGFDVFNRRPTLSGRDLAPIALGAIAWRQAISE
jgi:phytoene synthase